MPAPTPIRQRIRRRGTLTLIVGSAYALGAAGIAAILVWMQHFYHYASNPLVVSDQQKLFMLFSALGFTIGSAWYIYSGLQLRKLPPYRQVRRLLLATIVISVLSANGILSLVVLVSALQLLGQLDSYID